MTNPPVLRLLRREVGLPGAVVIGLGSILGTGVFVSIAIAAGAAGSLLPYAVVIAAAVALANGLSSAQLAAAHPVSGGTYEYGYKFVSPAMGFTAGWTFLCAKTASAATAALGASSYLGALFGWDNGLKVPIALVLAVGLTVITLQGVRRSNRVNLVIVSLTVFALGWFVVSALSVDSAGLAAQTNPDQGNEPVPMPSFLAACALLFVAFTGYGRIATMGEEVAEPERTIPRAVMLTLAASLLLYVGVAYAGLSAVGAGHFAASASGADAAALSRVLDWTGDSIGSRILAIGAITAMLGVLLNLILGLSRVWMAMARRGDMPIALASVKEKTSTPVAAVVLTGVTVCGLVLLGDVRTTWSFSAFTVLLYYAITNIAALRLPKRSRRYPRMIAWAGLGACLFLAFWVETTVWMAGLAVVVAGLFWYECARWFRR